MEDTLQNIRLEDGAVVILDQSLLPNEERYLRLTALEEMTEAIVSLRVRGAPALGIFGGYALYVLAQSLPRGEDFFPALRRCRDALRCSRPTAVNLGWALDRVMSAAQGSDHPLQAMERESRAIHAEDIEMCRRISAHGLTLLKDGFGVLTHWPPPATAPARAPSSWPGSGGCTCGCLPTRPGPCSKGPGSPPLSCSGRGWTSR